MAGGGIRAARNLSAGAVAVIAAWSSYSHMVHVALHYGERPEVAYALPFSVDGMLVVATIVMVDDKRRANRVRPMARLAFTAGVIASIAANIAAAHPTLGARIIDAWPALALLLVVEMLARPPATAAPSSDTHTVQPPAELGTAAQAPAEVRHGHVPPARHLPPLAPEAAEARGPHAAPGSSIPKRHLPRADTPSGGARGSAVLASPAVNDWPVARPVMGGDVPAQVGTPYRHSANTTHTSRDMAAPAEQASVAVAAEVPVPAQPNRAAVAAEVPPPPAPAGVPVLAELPTAAKDQVQRRNNPAVGQDRSPTSTQAPGTASTAIRRPTATTRALAQRIMDTEPHLSRTEVANRLGVSTRRLREVLAA